MTTSTDLRRFLDHAQQTHAQQTRSTADALQARAASLPADDEGAEAIRLAEHVMLGHLADAQALQRFLRNVVAPAESNTGPDGASPWIEAIARATWALAALSAQPDPSANAMLPDAARWRTLQNVVLALARGGRAAEASARLVHDEPAATTHADPAARRAFAACANNVALELREGPRGDAGCDALMLEAAALSRRAWTTAGTWLQVERADYQLARCHAVLGQGSEAVAFAQACLAACVAQGADAAERFFAHEALWHAQRAAADEPAATVARMHMQALLAEVDDGEMHAWCAQVLAEIDAPPLATKQA